MRVPVCQPGVLRPCHMASWRTCVQRKRQQTTALFQPMISNFHRPRMKSLHCQYPLPSYGDGVKHWRLNLLFVIQRNETIALLYGLITEINLGVDTENVDRRRGGESAGDAGERKQASKSNISHIISYAWLWQQHSDVGKWNSRCCSAV